MLYKYDGGKQMKIYEIDLSKIGDEYTTDSGEVWEVFAHSLYLKGSLRKNNIVDRYTLNDMLKINFEPVIDWSTVAVDTPVWVRLSDCVVRAFHFNYENNGLVWVWIDGCTSHTCEGTNCYEKEKVSLTKPK